MQIISKNLKRIIFCTVLLLTYFLAFSEGVNFNLMSKEVVVSGRIKVHVDNENFEFYAKTFGITDFSKPDCYQLINDIYERKTRKYPEPQYTEDELYIRLPQELFLSTQTIKKVKKKTELNVKLSIMWYFYSNGKFFVSRPLVFKMPVTKDIKYIYMGDIDFYLEGPNFKISKITVQDNYDAAKQEIEERSGKSINLYKAILQPVENQKFELKE